MTLTLDAFVRSVGINRYTPHAFLLGAGASMGAGIPDVETCIWQWKRDIYLTNHPGANGDLQDMTLPETRQAIQTWLEEQSGYPDAGSHEEYGFYVERCYPILHDRRRYFQRLSERAEPSVGHHLLCLLAEAEIVNAVWTTNFDGLVLRAAASSRITPIEVNLETATRVNRQPSRGELLHVSLHGEYRYDSLKNTDEEIQAQDETLRAALVEHLKSHTLIVSGYSGRDPSIMDTLKAAYSQPNAGRLYWCGYQQLEPDAWVAELLELARGNGHQAYYVPTEGFDDLLVRLALHSLRGKHLEQARTLTEITNPAVDLR
jgi:hypothetical protein